MSQTKEFDRSRAGLPDEIEEPNFNLTKQYDYSTAFVAAQYRFRMLEVQLAKRRWKEAAISAGKIIQAMLVIVNFILTTGVKS